MFGWGPHPFFYFSPTLSFFKGFSKHYSTCPNNREGPLGVSGMTNKITITIPKRVSKEQIFEVAFFALLMVTAPQT